MTENAGAGASGSSPTLSEILASGSGNGTLPAITHNGTLSVGAENATSTASNGIASPVLAPPVEFSWAGYFEAIGIMLILLAALWGVLWLVRRYAKFRFMPAFGSFPRNGLIIESQLPLGPRKGLFVVRFLNERLLLGVTEQHISLLQTIPLNAPDTSENNASENNAHENNAHENNAHENNASTHGTDQVSPEKTAQYPHNACVPCDSQAFARLLAAEQDHEGAPDELPRKP